MDLIFPLQLLDFGPTEGLGKQCKRAAPGAAFTPCSIRALQQSRVLWRAARPSVFPHLPSTVILSEYSSIQCVESYRV